MHRLTTLDARQHGVLTAHLLSLDAADRSARFSGAVDDAGIRRYVAGIGAAGNVLVGALRGRRLVGLAHAAVYAVRGELAAEIGISVDAGARKRGLGRQLLRAALDAARRLEVGRVHVVFASVNTAMAALARSLGARVEHDGADACAVFELRGEGTWAVPQSDDQRPIGKSRGEGPLNAGRKGRGLFGWLAALLQLRSRVG